jgi:transcriptional regulator with XRE-family HTH domain
VLDQEEFFRRLGKRVKNLRLDAKKTQEDMISEGFSARHWQQIESGRSITVSTALRICKTFGVRMGDLFKDLDDGL